MYMLQKGNKYDYQMNKIGDMVHIIDVHIILQRYMWIKFDVSMPGFWAVVDMQKTTIMPTNFTSLATAI